MVDANISASLPKSLVKRLVNVDRGREMNLYCPHCEEIRKSTTVSWAHGDKDVVSFIINNINNYNPLLNMLAGNPAVCHSCKRMFTY
ncbi:hypothetical protein ACFWNN_37460 [Lentzea sp. NPDC058450]|uniref:hypothetical protein n=1 Tax=Lentzea sp. NPDC058450 TaxID=3346505 RepID=UPI00364ACEA3